MEAVMDGDYKKWSRYWDRFQRLKESEGAIRLFGDTIIVEKCPPVEMKTKSGLIISTHVDTHKGTMEDGATHFGLVLMTGPGYFDEDGEDVPCQAKEGDILLIDPLAVNWWSQFGALHDYEPYSLGFINQQQLRITFPDYKRVFAVLNGGP